MNVFDEIEALPEGFLDVSSAEIAELFPRPSLVHLPGPSPALFVSILLHGNEDAGLMAIQGLMRRFPDGDLPRGLSLFIGNVDACTQGVRFLEHQVDFNRAWPTNPPRDPDDLTETHALLAAVRQRVLERGVFASVDVHNNTGRNPVYGCICSCEPHHVYLASLFSPTIVFFKRPIGVQTQAFMEHCPSVTCECGQSGDVAGAKAAADFLEKCLRLPHWNPPAGKLPEAQIYHTVARIKIREECSIGFEPGFDVVLRDDLDLLNFVELDAGERLGTLGTCLENCFIVNDELGRDVTGQYLSCAEQNLVLGQPAMPSMLTRNVDVIRKDCFGYLMEKMI